MREAYQRAVLWLIPTCGDPKWTVRPRNKICRPLIRFNTWLWKRHSDGSVAPDQPI